MSTGYFSQKQRAKLGEERDPDKVYFAQKMKSNRYYQNIRSRISRRTPLLFLLQLHCISFRIWFQKNLSAVMKLMYFIFSWERWRVTSRKYFKIISNASFSTLKHMFKFNK